MNSCNILLQNQPRFPVDHGKKPYLYILSDSDSLHAKLCGLYPLFFSPSSTFQKCSISWTKTRVESSSCLWLRWGWSY